MQRAMARQAKAKREKRGLRTALHRSVQHPLPQYASLHLNGPNCL